MKDPNPYSNAQREPDHRWQPIDTGAYVRRLEQARALLEQAAALALAQESARVSPVVELQRRLAQEHRGHPHR